MEEVIEITLVIISSSGFSGAITLGMSHWLGKIWADRLIDRERAKLKSDEEALVRKRDVYAKLAINMRVFLNSHELTKSDRREKFLEAYDEAYIWASQDVIEAMDKFIELIQENTAMPDSVPEQERRVLMLRACMRCADTLAIFTVSNVAEWRAFDA
jgi:hypothetical protein